jgi:hypothetical protein
LLIEEKEIRRETTASSRTFFTQPSIARLMAMTASNGQADQ